MGNNRKRGVGVVIGRFQTPYLHEGHMAVLNAANVHDKMVIFVGVHAYPGVRGNELDFETRMLMLREYFPDAIIHPLYDMATNDVWSKQLDKLIGKMFPFASPTFYHGRDSFAPCYEGKYKDNFHDIGEYVKDNATELREECYGKVLGSQSFRAGVFYRSNQEYPRINPTTDIAITRERDGKRQVLMGNRGKEDPRGWRFPGGHCDLTDESAEACAIREAQEETSLGVENPEYICSRRINDWRDAGRNKNLTFFYHFEYLFGAAKGEDDIEETRWIDVDELETINMVNEHRILAKELVKFLDKKYKKEGK